MSDGFEASSGQLPCLYIFLDEAGDLGFKLTGSKYFILTGVTTTRPFGWDNPLLDYKYDLLEWGLNVEAFHAAADNSYVRNRVLSYITPHLLQSRIDSLIVEKRKTVVALQAADKFYPRMLGYLVRYIISQVSIASYSGVIVITDTIPIKRDVKAIVKAIKETLSERLPSGVTYQIWHHASKSCMSLQVADYCSWAIFNKWERGDMQHYNLIQPAIQSEFDIFRKGTTFQY